MLNAASASSSLTGRSGGSLNAAPDRPGGPPDTVRTAFREFVVGTFYQQMLKALRSTQDGPAYFHGGRAEEMFQSRMDQQVAQDLASRHDGAFSEDLFEAFSRQLRASQPGSRLDASA